MINDSLSALKKSGKPDSNFDEIISLGYNCEVSFLIEDYWSRPLNSFLYTWAYVYDHLGFLDSLEHLDDVFRHEVSLKPWGMFLDECYGLCMHPMTPILRKDGEFNPGMVERALEELKTRSAYLAKKLKELFNSAKHTLFICKVKSRSLDEDYKYIKDLFETIQRNYHSGNFVLLCVLEQEYYQKNRYQALENDKLVIRSVERFADEAKTDTDSDFTSWKHIFNELDPAEGKNYEVKVSKRLKGRKYGWIIGRISKITLPVRLKRFRNWTSKLLIRY